MMWWCGGDGGSVQRERDIGRDGEGRSIDFELVSDKLSSQW